MSFGEGIDIRSTRDVADGAEGPSLWDAIDQENGAWHRRNRQRKRLRRRSRQLVPKDVACRDGRNDSRATRR